MHRKSLAGVLLGLLLLAAPATASSAPSRNAQAGCTIVNEGQTRTLVGQLTEDRYSEYYTSGGQPQTRNHKISRFSMGNLAIRAATCRAKGRWRVIDPLTVTPSYANMNTDGTVPFGATSWGLAPFRVKDRKLVIRSVWCKRAGSGAA